jgi:hypothetical protein
MPTNSQIEKKHFSHSSTETVTTIQLVQSIKQAFPWCVNIFDELWADLDKTCFAPRVSALKEPLPNQSRDITLDNFRFRLHLLQADQNKYYCPSNFVDKKEYMNFKHETMEDIHRQMEFTHNSRRSLHKIMIKLHVYKIVLKDVHIESFCLKTKKDSKKY